MSIRARIALWWSIILLLSLTIMGVVVYRELDEARHYIENGLKNPDSLMEETMEFVFTYGISTAILLLAFGLWFLYRSLTPVTRLTDAAEHLSLNNKQERLPISGTGDELDRLTQVFNTMTERLQSSYSQMREFTLHASHELKTPLTIIRGELETTLREGSWPCEKRELFVSLLDEVQRLTKIVDSLAMLSKADAGQIPLKMESLHLNELTDDILADAQVLAHPQEIEVQMSHCEPLVILGDRHRLRQLLLNLTDNAIKYNQPKGKILFSLTQDGDNALLSIKNTGPGLEVEKIPHVFERFYRGDPAHNSKIEGCGLGLSICQWIVQIHKGTIRFDSHPHDWTTVRVTFPLVKPQPGSTPSLAIANSQKP